MDFVHPQYKPDFSKGILGLLEDDFPSIVSADPLDLLAGMPAGRQADLSYPYYSIMNRSTSIAGLLLMDFHIVHVVSWRGKV